MWWAPGSFQEPKFADNPIPIQVPSLSPRTICYVGISLSCFRLLKFFKWVKDTIELFVTWLLCAKPHLSDAQPVLLYLSWMPKELFLV